MNFITQIKNIIPAELYKKLFKLFIFTVIGIFFELLGIGLVLPVITIITTGEFEFNTGLEFDKTLNNSISNLDSSELFVIPLVILLLAYTLKGAYLFFLRYYNGKFSYNFILKLSSNIYQNFLYQDQFFHLKRNSSDLIRIITTEIPFFLKNIVMPLLVIFMEIFILVGIVLLLLAVETKGTLIILGIIIFLSYLYYLIIRSKLKKWGQERIFHEGKKMQNLIQGLHGIKSVKIFNQEKTFLNKFNFNVAGSSKSNQYATLVSQTPPILIEFMAISLIVLFMIYNVQSSVNITEYFPKMVLFAAAAFRLMPSFGRLIVNFQTFKLSLAGVQKLHKEFPLKLDSHILNGKETKIIFKDKIEISNLSFKYPNNDEYILKDINLKIKSGESIGIVGKTGEGKSTIIDLVCGLIQPQKGNILVDSIDIQKNLKSWQQQIGYVPQNIYILDDTIRENIIFGRKIDDNNQNYLTEAIKLAQLDNLISNLPQGLNTFVGDRGTRLSGGQIQRIGIARAIMNNAQVLIFDEPTSALDAETEKSLVRDINKLKFKKTLIIISHRTSILDQCDYIYELKNKSIFLKK
jgi:ABC-type multidrug transport system fused ATPase/permease subunit